MPVWIKYIGVAALAYAAYGALVFAFQRQMIFPRSQIDYAPAVLPDSLAIEKTWLTIPGASVESWYIPPSGGAANGPKPALIFAHGNAERIDLCAAEMVPFTALGIGVLLVEYPGYGRSTGRPSQASITAAFIAAYDMLAARPGVDASKIVLYGRSLGGGAVCALAAKRPAAALILASTFTGIRAMASRYLVPGFMVRDPFDNLAVMRDFSGPILIVHGRDDDIIPFHHGLALQKAARRATLLAYDCGHNDCPPNQARFRRDIAAFLRETGILQSR
ncbi:MAG: alpha/beta hydrolase [Desulfobacterales bacterium]